MKSIKKIIHNQTLTFDFRKNGISIPSFPSLNNLNVLKSAIEDYNPKQVVFLGDLFHSDYNLEWGEWLTFFETSKITFTESKSSFSSKLIDNKSSFIILKLI